MLARKDNDIVAGAIILCFNRHLYFWDGVSFRKFYHLAPNNLLHWNVIEWGFENGMTQYDMMGANIPNIARFKMSFGAHKQSYVLAHKGFTWRASIEKQLRKYVVPQLRRFQVPISASRL